MSKITDGFEEKNMVEVFGRYTREETERLLSHTRNVETFLKNKQWVYVPGRDPFCIGCGASKENHDQDSPNCELNKLLS